MMLRASDELWKEGGGYYTEAADELRMQPLLPSPLRLHNRRLMELLERSGNLKPGSSVLEVGCGRSPWLPFLARDLRCSATGIDVEPIAVDLARANLEGADARAEIRCSDGFSLAQNQDLVEKFDLVYSMGLIEHFEDATARLAVLREYLRPGGRILTTVPNLQGVNWLLQWLGGVDRLEMHVLYDSKRLARAHEEAGFRSIASGYVGFCEGYLSAAGKTAGKLRRGLHLWLCWVLGVSCEAWVRAGKEIATPELAWLSPHVYYVGQRH